MSFTIPAALARANSIKGEKGSKPGNRRKKSVVKQNSDVLWSKAVRSVGVCEFEGCGTTRADLLEAHHIVTRSNKSLRYELKNGICLCKGCHTVNSDSAHKAPADFIRWLCKTDPERMGKLIELNHSRAIPLFEMEEIEKRLKKTK